MSGSGQHTTSCMHAPQQTCHARSRRGLDASTGRVTAARASALPAHKVTRRLGIQDLDPITIGVCQPRHSSRVSRAPNAAGDISIHVVRQAEQSSIAHAATKAPATGRDCLGPRTLDEGDALHLAVARALDKLDAQLLEALAPGHILRPELLAQQMDWLLKLELVSFPSQAVRDKSLLVTHHAQLCMASLAALVHPMHTLVCKAHQV